jgi:hypothetical protein
VSLQVPCQEDGTSPRVLRHHGGLQRREARESIGRGCVESAQPWQNATPGCLGAQKSRLIRAGRRSCARRGRRPPTSPGAAADRARTA